MIQHIKTVTTHCDACGNEIGLTPSERRAGRRIMVLTVTSHGFVVRSLFTWCPELLVRTDNYDDAVRRGHEWVAVDPRNREFLQDIDLG